jgi:branched-chain amino acid transport system permease protein
MLDLVSNIVAANIATNYRVIIDIAMYFGLFVIVTMSLNFQYGNAGIPNMGCAVQVIVGGFAVSYFATRLSFFLLTIGGINLLPYESNYDWIYNNPFNIVTINNYIMGHPFFGVGILLFSLAVSLALGIIIGWFVSLPAIRLRSTYLMITLIAISDGMDLFARNWQPLCGGTLGIYVPDVYAWYPGDRGIISAVVALFIGLISFLIFRKMLNSPYGRLMRSLRENDVTLNSVGKNSAGIRRNILMFASAITALSGALLAFYFSFVIDTNYSRGLWTYWPWLMIMLGGPGNNAGAFLGCAFVVALRRLIITYKWVLDPFIFFPMTYFEQLILGLMLVVVIMVRPQGLIKEKLLYIPGVHYEKLIKEDAKVDWRAAKRKKKSK